MTKYIMIDNAFEPDKFYSHLHDLEELTVEMEYDLIEKPAATVEFKGSIKQLYGLLGYSDAEVTIGPVVKYKVPPPHPIIKVKRI